MIAYSKTDINRHLKARGIRHNHEWRMYKSIKTDNYKVEEWFCKFCNRLKFVTIYKDGRKSVLSFYPQFAGH